MLPTSSTSAIQNSLSCRPSSRAAPPGRQKTKFLRGKALAGYFSLAWTGGGQDTASSIGADMAMDQNPVPPVNIPIPTIIN